MLVIGTDSVVTVGELAYSLGVHLQCLLPPATVLT